MNTPDLFWKWSIAPGGLVPARTHYRYTLTGSNGGGYLVIWDRNRIHARGGAAMINRIWQDLTA